MKTSGRNNVSIDEKGTLYNVKPVGFTGIRLAVYEQFAFFYQKHFVKEQLIELYLGPRSEDSAIMSIVACTSPPTGVFESLSTVLIMVFSQVDEACFKWTNILSSASSKFDGSIKLVSMD